MVKVYDKYGVERTLAWLYDEFGNVEIEAPPDPAGTYFEIVELREIDDIQPGHQVAGADAYAAIVTKVLDENGAAMPGVTAVFWWPDAPNFPGAGWHNRGVGGATGPGGTVDFAMGPGAFYNPANAQGPHHLWIYGEGSSQIIRGLGMIAGTNHRHLDVTFQRQGSQPPDPPPGDLDIPAAILRICNAKAAIDMVEVYLAEALHALGGTCPE